MIDSALQNPVVKAAAVSAAAVLGREIMRGIFGTGRKSRRR